ncbi:hypothetical protein CLOM_g8333 [Closterium sp. NIES-68]|nr:hypothetical protein CLOM_g8333 [Closterium sp. NIES-68]GJP59255.1 hypothetical protein CLOP_g10068 [Closterium sp. NIES-67]
MANPSFSGGPSPHGLDVAGMLQLARQRVDEGQPSAALQLIITVLRAQGGEAAVLSALTRARAMHHDRQQLQQGADDITALLARCAIGTADVAVPAGSGQMIPGGPMERGWQGQGGGSAVAWGGGADEGMGGDGMGEGEGGQQRVGGMEGIDQTGRYGVSSIQGGGMNGAAGYGMDQERRYGVDQERRYGVDRAPILAEQGRMQVVVDASADGSSVTCHMCHGVISGARWKEHLQFWCRAAARDATGNDGLSP